MINKRYKVIIIVILSQIVLIAILIASTAIYQEVRFRRYLKCCELRNRFIYDLSISLGNNVNNCNFDSFVLRRVEQKGADLHQIACKIIEDKYSDNIIVLRHISDLLDTNQFNQSYFLGKRIYEIDREPSGYYSEYISFWGTIIIIVWDCSDNDSPVFIIKCHG